jgi:integrase-like protein
VSCLAERWRNGYIESFNGRLRDECLNLHLFWSLTHARVVISDWKASTTSTDDTQPSATRPRLDTLGPAPTNDRLSQSPDQFRGPVTSRSVRVVWAVFTAPAEWRCILLSGYRGGLEGFARIRPDPGVQRLAVTHDLPDSHDESMHCGPRQATLCTLTTS